MFPQEGHRPNRRGSGGDRLIAWNWVVSREAYREQVPGEIRVTARA